MNAAAHARAGSGPGELDAFYARLFSERFFVFEDEAPYFQEKLLQVIWNEGWAAGELQTAGGEPLRVVHPGVWNVGAGPDFRDALLQWRGRAVRGDVELHLRPEAWQAHGHSRDAGYGNVVLHVVWSNPAKVAEYPLGVPVCALEGQLTRPLAQIMADVNLATYPYARQVPPGEWAAHLARLSDGALRELLQSYGVARALAKAQELSTAIVAHGLEETVYARLLEVMGYYENRAAGAQLAAQWPLAECAGAGEGEMVACLLGAAGLLPDPTRDRVDPAHRALVQGLWRIWWPRRREFAPIPWVRKGLRPLNAPERRVVAAALLVARHRCRLGEALIQAFATAADGRAAMAAVRACLAVPACEPWPRLYSFARPPGKPAALLGAARTNELLVNLAVPLFLAWCLLRDRPEWCSRAKTALAALPRLADNRRLREGAHRLFTPPARAKLVVANACAQQGLLKLLDDWGQA